MQASQQIQRRQKPIIRRRCKCGCGELFLPARKTQKFLNEAHRLEHYADAFITVSRAEYEEFLKWRDAQNEKAKKKAGEKASSRNKKPSK